jgi:hypothetical protein
MKRWANCHVIVQRPDGTPPARVDALLNQHGAEGYWSTSNIR